MPSEHDHLLIPPGSGGREEGPAMSPTASTTSRRGDRTEQRNQYDDRDTTTPIPCSRAGSPNFRALQRQRSCVSFSAKYNNKGAGRSSYRRLIDEGTWVQEEGAGGRKSMTMTASQSTYYQEEYSTSAGIIPTANMDQVYRMSVGGGRLGAAAAGVSRVAREEEQKIKNRKKNRSCVGVLQKCLNAKPLSSSWWCCGTSEAHIFIQPRIFFPFSVLFTGNFRHIYVIRSSHSLQDSYGENSPIKKKRGGNGGNDDAADSPYGATTPPAPGHYHDADDEDDEEQERDTHRMRMDSDAISNAGDASRALAAAVNRPLYINVPMLFIGLMLAAFLWVALWLPFGATFAPKGELFHAIFVAVTAGMLGAFVAWMWGLPASIGIMWFGIFFQHVEGWLGLSDDLLAGVSSLSTNIVLPYNPSIYSKANDSSSPLADGFGSKYLLPMKLLCVCLVLLRSSFALGSGLTHPFAFGRVLVLSLLPLAMDAVVSGLLANFLFGYDGDLGWIFLHGFVCAPLSSSIMHLGALYVQSKGRGNDGGPLQLILPANSIDSALGTWCCTIALSVVLNDVSVSEGINIEPGTVKFGFETTSAQVAQAICEVIGGLIVGGGSAMMCAFLSSQLFAIDLPHWYNREGFFATAHTISSALTMSFAIAMFFSGFAMQVEGAASLSVVTFGMVLSYLWSSHAETASRAAAALGEEDTSVYDLSSPSRPTPHPSYNARYGVGGDGDDDGDAVPTAPFADSRGQYNNQLPFDDTATSATMLRTQPNSTFPLKEDTTTTNSGTGNTTTDRFTEEPSSEPGCSTLWRAGARGSVQDAGKLLYTAYLEGNAEVSDATEEELQYTISTNSTRYAAALADENKKRFINAMASLYTLFVQPCLYSFLGATIHVSDIFGDWNFLWRATAIWAIGTVARMLTAPIAAIGTDFSVKERIVLGLTWIGKSTTQASLGSMALHKALMFQHMACTSSSSSLYSGESATLDTTTTPTATYLFDSNTTAPTEPPTVECMAMGEFVRRARCVELSALVCILFGTPAASFMMRKVATRWVRRDK